MLKTQKEKENQTTQETQKQPYQSSSFSTKEIAQIKFNQLKQNYEWQLMTTTNSLESKITVDQLIDFGATND
jgi:hypothetical protein